VAIPVADALVNLHGFFEGLVALAVGPIDGWPWWEGENVVVVAIRLETGCELEHWSQLAEHAQGVNGAAIEEDQAGRLPGLLVLGNVGAKDLLRELQGLRPRTEAATLSIADDCSRGLADCGVAARGQRLQYRRFTSPRGACEYYGLHS
jgi:hypothetical protein